MLKNFAIALLITFSLFAEEKKVLVSVAPYVTICKDLAEVEIDLLVPAGFSSHTYEPTPKQVLGSLDARLWFTIGELFEVKMRTVLQNENPKLLIVDLQKGLQLMHETCHHHHQHQASDPHIWMSPKMMLVQVRTMAKGLKEAFSDIQVRLDQTVKKLEELDKEILEILASKKGTKVFVSHPAYGYFCKDYGLEQIPIEFEGKDPTARTLTEVVAKAKKLNVKTIFIQKQYSTKAAYIIAQQIDAKLVELDPYAEDYYESMLKIANAFAKGAV